MSSSVGNDTTTTIVTSDTMELINQADSIVKSCTGVNCNTSPATRQSITQKLSSTAQAQANSVMSAFSIATSSVVGRNIFNGYIDLAAAVSSTYNYQCGTTTVNSVNCVTSADSVQTAQNNLESLLLEPITNDSAHIIILSILIVIGIISFILFLVFMLVWLVRITSPPTLVTINTVPNIVPDGPQDPNTVIIPTQDITTPIHDVNTPIQDTSVMYQHDNQSQAITPAVPTTSFV